MEEAGRPGTINVASQEILTELGWKCFFLIPKGNTNNTQGISFLGTLWNVKGAIIKNRLKVCIAFHDVLHGLHTGRGMGTAILELKLAQEMEITGQYPLFLVFLDIHKEYATLEWGHLLMTLEGYGDGPNICRILAEFLGC